VSKRLPPKNDEVQFYEKAKFKKLREKWYKKLEKSGFVEIEAVHTKNELVKDYHSSHFMKDYVVDNYDAKQKYFELAREILHTYEFKNKQDKLVWELYSEGMECKTIARKLKKSEYKLSKFIKTVEKLIVQDAGETLNKLDEKKKSDA
jgi:hypothetical protein